MITTQSKPIRQPGQVRLVSALLGGESGFSGDEKMTVTQIIQALRNCDLAPDQRKSLNNAVRNFNARRPGGGRLHHPSHYVPQIVAMARKHGIIDDATKISRVR